MKTMFASWRYRLSRLALLTSLLLGGFATDLSAATLTWTGAGGDDSWHNRTNWSTLTVPGAADDAVINAPALTVVHSNGNTTVRSLQCATAFSITGGTMTLTTGASQVNGEFTMLRISGMPCPRFCDLGARKQRLSGPGCLQWSPSPATRRKDRR